MRQFGQNIFQGFSITFWVVCLLGLFACYNDAWGRLVGKKEVSQSQEITQEAKNVQKIAEMILEDYVSKNMPLVSEDIEEIEKELKLVDRYFSKFSSEQKSYYYLVRAYLSHYSEKPKKDAVLTAQKAYNADSENMDAGNSLIALSLYYGKYSIAQKILKELKAGEAVIIKPKLEKGSSGHASHMSRAGDPNSSDPNSMGYRPGGGNDPNSSGNLATGNGNKKSEKKSRWTQTRRQKKTEQNTSSRRHPGPEMMPPGMGPGMPGMGMGPGAGMPPRMSDPRSSRRPAARRRNSGKTHLDIPHKYMPYTHLGQTFQSLNVRNVNGSLYQFDSGQGEVLCALLWTLPQEEKSSRSSSRQEGGQGGHQMPVQDIVVDLWGNVDQFRTLYRFHRQSGKAQFVTVNLDAATSENIQQVEELFMEKPWPWVNFIAQDSGHISEWKLKGQYSQAMVIVDPAGTIRYMGPVGGFLPLMLLDAQLEKATARQGMMPAVAQKKEKEPVVQVASPEKKVSQTKQPESTLANSPSPTPSSRQAKQILEAARVKKRISKRGALNMYDDIISRFGDTQEVQIARMQIKAICRKDSRLKKERTKAGKYTGFK